MTSLFSLVIPLCPNVTGTLRCYFSVHHQRNTAGFCVVLAESVIDMLQVLNWTLLLNSPDHLTQTVDVAPKHTAGEPTVRTARAQKATAAGKSLKGKALKQTAKVAGPKAKTGAPQTKPTSALKDGYRKDPYKIYKVSSTRSGGSVKQTPECYYPFPYPWPG